MESHVGWRIAGIGEEGGQQIESLLSPFQFFIETWQDAPSVASLPLIWKKIEEEIFFSFLSFFLSSLFLFLFVCGFRFPDARIIQEETSPLDNEREGNNGVREPAATNRLWPLLCVFSYLFADVSSLSRPKSRAVVEEEAVSRASTTSLCVNSSFSLQSTDFITIAIILLLLLLLEGLW